MELCGTLKTYYIQKGYFKYNDEIKHGIGPVFAYFDESL